MGFELYPGCCSIKGGFVVRPETVVTVVLGRVRYVFDDNSSRFIVAFNAGLLFCSTDAFDGSDEIVGAIVIPDEPDVCDERAASAAL